MCNPFDIYIMLMKYKADGVVIMKNVYISIRRQYELNENDRLIFKCKAICQL